MAARKRGLKIQNVLAQSGLIDEMQLRSALARGDQWGTRLPRTVVDMQFCTEDQVMEVLSEGLRMPLTSLARAPRDAQALSKLTEEYCVEWGLFPMQLKNRVLTLAMADPTELDIIDEIQQRTQLRVQPMLAAESDIQAAIKREYVRVRAPTAETPMAVPRQTVEFHLPGEKEFEFGDGAPPRPEAPVKRAPPSRPVTRRPTDINDFLSAFGAADTTLFSPDELAQLKAVQQTQEKTRRISQAITELLTEKGLLP